VTVTAKNPNLTTATSYRGTLHFTSNDSLAVLPADYTFTSADAGNHVFNGVVLNTPGTITITATDPVTSYTIGTGAFTVTCNGVCPAPGGTAGARDANAGPAGTAGAREANQSPAGSVGPRLPRLGRLAYAGDTASGAVLATAVGPGSRSGGAAPAASTSTTAAAPAIAATPAEAEIAVSPASQAAPSLIAGGADMKAASHIAATKVESISVYLPLVLFPLAIITLALLVVRRRMTRRLIGRTRP
jgi:hypothetical protein